MGAFIDLTGQKFGRYTVISRAPDKVDKSGKARVMWRCKCECGKVKDVLGYSLTSGSTLSCGCYKSEVKRKALTTHGATLYKKPTHLYMVWDGMKERCNNPHKNYYERYGGRGIQVCDEWLRSFEAFRDWSYANGYAEGLTIDRIDNDKGYSPDNCRWATVSQQNNNKSTNHYLTYNGETKTIMQWAEATGFTFHTILFRIAKGMTVEEALLTPRKVKGTGHFEYVPSKLATNK